MKIYPSLSNLYALSIFFCNPTMFSFCLPLHPSCFSCMANKNWLVLLLHVDIAPPAKHWHGLTGSIVSTALSAALISTAVGLTVYCLYVHPSLPSFHPILIADHIVAGEIVAGNQNKLHPHHMIKENRPTRSQSSNPQHHPAVQSPTPMIPVHTHIHPAPHQSKACGGCVFE
jgi:hypothetical protein